METRNPENPSKVLQGRLSPRPLDPAPGTRKGVDAERTLSQIGLPVESPSESRLASVPHGLLSTPIAAPYVICLQCRPGRSRTFSGKELCRQ